MKLESEKAGVILGFIGVSWVSRGTLEQKANALPPTRSDFNLGKSIHQFIPLQ